MKRTLRNRVDELDARIPDAPKVRPAIAALSPEWMQRFDREYNRRRLVEARYRLRTPPADQLDRARREEAQAIEKRGELRAKSLPPLRPDFSAHMRAYLALNSAECAVIQATSRRQRLERLVTTGEMTYQGSIERDNDVEIVRRADGGVAPKEPICGSCSHYVPAGMRAGKPIEGFYCTSRMLYAGERAECYNFEHRS